MKLVDLLQINYIKYPLTASNKVDVIKELLALFSENNLIQNHEEVLKAVLEREKILSTGLGNGVALPHCKTNSVEEFMIALGIHPKGVDFQSLDHKPAHIIFLLIGPESKPGFHIRLLSRISRIISKEDVRKQILAGKSPEEIYQIFQAEEANFFEISL
jgi:fructose-specific phosphotransferase system IIA component